MRHAPLATLLFTLTAAYAADPAATTPTPPPPPPAQWSHAIPATVVIGSDVGVGATVEAYPTPLLLKLDDAHRLHDVGSKSAECVIDAEAAGNLASERVNIRLVGIRCFDADGAPTINKPLRGYVVDKDARTGIKGNVYWSQSAKDLVMLGVGTQTRQSMLMKSAQSALNHATWGIGEGLISKDDEKNGPPQDAIHELRSADTLMPVLTLEPGRALNLVILGGVQ
ncbi:MAG: hypothetical protein JO218_16875 [Burkholderiales bacterium]|nr:hypothetical protein [Burkholderiales bacterium]